VLILVKLGAKNRKIGVYSNIVFINKAKILQHKTVNIKLWFLNWGYTYFLGVRNGVSVGYGKKLYDIYEKPIKQFN